MRRRAGNFTSAVSVLAPARSPLAAAASVIRDRTRFIWIVLLWGFSPAHLRHADGCGSVKPLGYVPLDPSILCSIEARRPASSRWIAGDRSYDERKPNQGRKQPEHDLSQLV